MKANKLLSIFTVLCVLLIGLSAKESTDITWQWDIKSKDIEAFRFQLNEQEDGKWTILSGEESSITTNNLDSSIPHTLYLQYSKDGKTWSNTFSQTIENSNSNNKISATWEVTNLDSSIKYLRYRVDSKEWQNTNPLNSRIKTEGLSQGKPHTLDLQYSLDNITWNDLAQKETIPYLVDIPIKEESPNYFGFRVSISPLTLGIYDFFNGHNVVDAEYLTVSKLGFSTNIELFWNINERFSLYGGTSYSRIQKKESIIPNSTIINHHNIEIGLDIKVFSINPIDFSIGIFSGAMMNRNAGYSNWSPLLGTKFNLTWNITEHFSLGLESKVSFSYQHNKDPLYRSMSYLIDALALTIETSF